MRYRSLIQLAPGQFSVHFPQPARDRQIARLEKMTQLLHPLPVSDLRAGELDETLPQIDILLTGWQSGTVDAELRRRMPNLKLIAHLAGTVKKVLTPDIAGEKLRVISATGANARPVAEFTLAHILLHLKRVTDWQRLYHGQRSALAVRRTTFNGPVGNTGRTVGIIGASRIGRRVVRHLRGHGIHVLLHDPYLTAQEARGIGAEKVTMETLLRRSDVVSLHQPLLPSTEKSFGAKEFALMQDGALLINTARGRIVDTPALEVAMADGRLHAVLDVTDPEPLNDDSPLWSLPNVSLTPHIAGSIGCEVSDMTDMVLDDIDRFCRGAPLESEVALDDWEKVA